jgi:hypothetical protein
VKRRVRRHPLGIPTFAPSRELLDDVVVFRLGILPSSRRSGPTRAWVTKTDSLVGRTRVRPSSGLFPVLGEVCVCKHAHAAIL